MTWEPTVEYKAKIGGIVFENVQAPIVLEDSSLVSFTRNTETGELGVNFAIEQTSQHDAQSVLAVINNQIVTYKLDGMMRLNAYNRSSLINPASGAVIVEINKTRGRDFELALTFSLTYHDWCHLHCHPDRTEILVRPDRSRPTFTGLHLVSETPERGIGFSIARSESSQAGGMFGVPSGVCIRNGHFTNLQVGLLLEWGKESE